MGFKDGISKIFRLKRGQKKKAIKLALEPEESPGTMRSELYAMDIPARVEPLTIGVEKGFKVVESYPLEDPWARAVILQNPSTGETLYYVDEIQLTREEREVYKRLMDILYWELEPPKEGVDPREHFKKQAKSVIEKYRLKFMETISPAISWGKIYYYVIRDTVGYGPIDALMKDENIEDISCDGVGRPIYVWHRRYESIPTNIRFTSDEELDSLVIKLAHKAGKHVSVAFPIVDAILPGGHRLAATYKREVSMSGSTFTIRKFREKPLSIIDLLKGGTMSPDLAAYLWLAMEFKMTGLIMGVTGSGKTTTLNALTTLFRPTIKVVTIEDTPELRLTLENWVQLAARPSYGLESRRGEITLYDLVKVSLRYRPDVIIVGEVRGEEAKVLFQALATGHGGITTIHAESIDAAVKRLTSPPMDIPPSYIPLMNFALVVKRIRLQNPDGTYRVVRRVTDVWEIRDYNDYPLIAKWDPRERRHVVFLDRSKLLESIGEEVGEGLAWALEEVEKRSVVLRWMMREGITDYRHVASVIQEYYARPEETYEKARNKLKRYEAFG